MAGRPLAGIRNEMQDAFNPQILATIAHMSRLFVWIALCTVLGVDRISGSVVWISFLDQFV